MQNNRLEKDTMGEIAVPNERLWGAQTQRSLEHFKISHEKMPPILLKALAYIKQAAAKVNGNLHLLPDHKVTAIIQAADEVIQQQHLSEFPLVIWQTGSGTQTNMNMNEVIANRASELLGGQRGNERLVHPNDDVNMSQSSNDVFPAAMHIAAVMSLQPLLAALSALQMTFEQKASHYHTLVKIGRTHLQDATPLTLGQEISGWNSMLQYHEQHIQQTFSALYELALGGTAVGTGLNAPKGYVDAIAKELAVLTQLPFMSAPNKFSALAGCDALVNAHSTLKGLATALMKIANDIRWLASGPRCGIGELTLPENEPGSSIMPGKVNPTQCEALTMLCVQIMGNDVAIGMGGASGNFELNVFRPMIIHNFLQSMRLLTDGMHSFNQHCAMGMMANEARIQQLLNESLMLVTALSPHIGYDKAAAIAKKAHQDNLTLKQAAVLLGWVTEAEFHQWVNPKNMVGLDEC